MQLSKGGPVPGSEGYNNNPTDNDRMHCVVLVMSTMTVSTMDESVEKKIKDIREEADQRSKLLMLRETNRYLLTIIVLNG